MFLKFDYSRSNKNEEKSQTCCEKLHDHPSSEKEP
jgi:hypothetical protein